MLPLGPLDNLTSGDVLRVIRSYYHCENDDPMGPEWASLAEFCLRPGFDRQRCDLFMVRAWRGQRGHERHAIEVKVSRSDLQKDLDHPGKRAAFETVSNRFYFATPEGLMGKREVPDGCGLYTVNAKGVRKVVEAPLRMAEDIGEQAFVEAFRRASRAEARVRQADTGDAAAMVVDLQARLDKAERALDTAREKQAKERERAHEAVTLMAETLGEVPCQCGHGIIVATKRTARGGHIRWEHSPAVGNYCHWPRPDLDAVLRPVERSGGVWVDGRRI